MSFNPATSCLKHCFGACHLRHGSASHRASLSHEYSLHRLVFGDRDEIDYHLARTILEYLLQNDEYNRHMEFKSIVDEYYGTVLFETGKSTDDWKLCVKHLNNAIKRRERPQNINILSENYNRCAIVYDSHLNDNEKAKHYYSMALQLLPENVTFNRNYATFLCENTHNPARFSQSMPHWTKANMEFGYPNSFQLYAYGKALFNLGDFTKSIKYLNKAIGKDESYQEECALMLQPSRDISHLSDMYIKSIQSDATPQGSLDMWYENDDIGIQTLLHCFESFEDSWFDKIDIKKYFQSKFLLCKDNNENSARFARKQKELGSFFKTYIPLLLEIFSCGVSQDSGDDFNRNANGVDVSNDVKKEEKKWMETMENEKLDSLLKMENKNKFLENYHKSMVLVEKLEKQVLVINQWKNKVQEIQEKERKLQALLDRIDKQLTTSNKETATMINEFEQTKEAMLSNLSSIIDMPKIFKRHVSMQNSLNRKHNKISTQLEREKRRKEDYNALFSSIKILIIYYQTIYQI